MDGRVNEGGFTPSMESMISHFVLIAIKFELMRLKGAG